MAFVIKNKKEQKFKSVKELWVETFEEIRKLLKKVFYVFVKIIKWFFEIAKGISSRCFSKTLKYSKKKLLSMSDFFSVSSKLFKTIHFLTISHLFKGRLSLNTSPKFLHPIHPINRVVSFGVLL